MTIVAVTCRYTNDVAARDRVLPAHREYLRGLAAQGLLLVSGPFGPDEPRGALLLFSADKSTVIALIDNDPFTSSGVIAKTEITVWGPVIGPLLAAMECEDLNGSARGQTATADRPDSTAAAAIGPAIPNGRWPQRKEIP